MAGNTNYPTALDDDASLYDVTDNVTAIIAAHHNNIKESVKAIERRIGIISTGSATAIDYRLGNPTDSHRHDGATGQGQRVNPTTIPVPSGGYPSGGYLYDHLMNATLHNPSALLATGIATMLAPALVRVPSQVILRATGIATVVSQSEATAVIHVPSGPVLRATGIASVVSQSGATALFFVPTQVPYYVVPLHLPGSIPSGLNRGIPLSFGRTMQIENIRANLKIGPSAATAVANVKFGPTGLWTASLGNRPMFAPGGATNFGHASPNLVTYPSGAIITLDIDEAATPDQSTDLSVILVFRE